MRLTQILKRSGEVSTTPYRKVNYKESGKSIGEPEKDMSQKKENFNVTQGMTLLLLKKLSLPANFVFQLILFITNPENNIGYED